jgi:hypothetical protein
MRLKSQFDDLFTLSENKTKNQEFQQQQEVTHFWHFSLVQVCRMLRTIRDSSV